VRPTLVIANGPAVFLIGGDGPRVAGPFLLDPDPAQAASRFERLGPADLPAGLLRALPEGVTTSPLRASPPRLARALTESTGRGFEAPPVEELRRARLSVPPTESEVERRFFLSLGRLRLERALRAPEEVLITLAREEERVERSAGREARAAEAYVAVPDSAADRHLPTWTRARQLLGELAAELRRNLELEARRLVPNLSAVVGPRTAGRLVAAAGGVGPLARMPSARIQLLGSRRRPSPERGPRYGILYRADRVQEVPGDRRGAYARSLAALAAIAVRVDASTRRDVSSELIGRRDRRVEALRRRRA